MANSGLNKILALSPYIELLVRRFYRDNVALFSKFVKKGAVKSELKDFNKIISSLKDLGINNGSFVVMHSSYEAIQGTGKTPKKILEEFLNLVGESGTLAMNSARRYPEEASYNDYLTADYTNVTVTYDVHKSRVWTGALPFFMLKHPNAHISRFPINPMVAIGKHAKNMMEHNLDEDLGTACGKSSSWNYCVENDAIIVGIGIDLTHSLTMIHVAEDVMDEKWPVKNWYRERKFKIIDAEYEELKTVRERRPRWGALHFAERTLCKDLILAGILTSIEVDGVLVETIRAKELICFLNSRNVNGYPYYFVKN